MIYNVCKNDENGSKSKNYNFYKCKAYKFYVSSGGGKV